MCVKRNAISVADLLVGVKLPASIQLYVCADFAARRAAVGLHADRGQQLSSCSYRPANRVQYQVLPTERHMPQSDDDAVGVPGLGVIDVVEVADVVIEIPGPDPLHEQILVLHCRQPSME